MVVNHSLTVRCISLSYINESYYIKHALYHEVCHHGLKYMYARRGMVAVYLS